MNQETIDTLEAINRDFYGRRAHEFSLTRQHPWPGWNRVLDSFRRHGRALSREHRGSIVGSRALFDVLDAGCGNGRFARLLDHERAPGSRYLGVDASPALVAEATYAASRRGGPWATWLVLDLCGREPGLWPLAGRTGIARCVVAFGVLHHVAALERRLQMLSNLASALEPGGLLAVSFWQFGDRERFRRRIVSWGDYNRGAETPIDAGQLESGDHLLAWGDREGGRASLRYCHHADPTEAARLVEATGLEPVETFRADGRSDDLNLYYVLRRSISS